MTLLDAPWLRALWERVAPSDLDAIAFSEVSLLVALAVAGAAIAIPPVWRILRLVVTLVHELGHAMTGVLVGRRFTGFVLRGDMSGHAVTAGKPRGFGRAVTTWAGYPAPAIVGAAMAWLGAQGWAAATIAACLVVVLIALIRVRSFLTAIVTIAALAGLGALFWWRDDALQAHVLLTAGTLLVVGAWRHLGAVWGSGGRTSDPAVLRSLTGVPTGLWIVSFALVCLGASVVVGLEFWTVLRQ